MSDLISYNSSAASLFSCAARQTRETTCEGCQKTVDAEQVVIVAGWQLCPGCAAQVKEAGQHDHA